MDVLMIIQFLIVLLALFVGARYGSLALGAISGIGLAILVLGFGLKPGTPPTDVIYIIIAAVTCAGMLQASGGMNWMIQVAERMLRSHPAYITILAPFVTFFLTVLVGTGHVVYTIMPIICDISLKQGIRPERPCGIASIASQIGITCSPIAAAVVSFMTISNANGFDVSIFQILMVTIPACLIGIISAIIFSYNRGLDLDKDPQFQARCKDPETYNYMYGNSATTLNQKIETHSKIAVWIFLAALASIVIFAIFPDLLPRFADAKGNLKPLKMNLLIQIMMLTAAALMVFFAKAEPKKAVSGAVWQSGMVAAVAIFGIAWMADTYFGNYTTQIKEMMGDIVAQYPWAIAFVFFLVSVLINSQGAVVVAMLPLAYEMGIDGVILLGVMPSVYGYFFIPNYPSDIATVNFDRSGTTVIGKYLFNHSFMIPGLIHVVVATIAGLLLAQFYHSMNWL